MGKRWTQEEVDAIVNEALKLEGLPDDQVAAGKASIEAKYGLSPGMLSKSNLSTDGEAEVAERKHGKIIKTFEAIDHWPYFRLVDRPKEKIPEVFEFSEALRRKPVVSFDIEKEKSAKHKSAQELYADYFREKEKRKAFK
jgi:hypothetical protein